MPARLILIGDRMFPEFREVMEWIASSASVVDLVAQFADLRTAVRSAGAALVQCDLILMLQRHPYQDAVHDIPEFIGRTLGIRVICCYARACDSDARSRELWPPALRVPAVCAVSVLRVGVERFLQVLPQLPVTASPEEVFVDRCDTDVWPTLTGPWLSGPASGVRHSGPERQSGPERSCGVASDDRVLRQTIAEGLRAAGLRAFDFPLQLPRIVEFQKCHRHGAILVDVDAPARILEAALSFEDASHPGFLRIGFSALIPATSERGLSAYRLNSLVSTQDLLHGILRHQVLQSV